MRKQIKARIMELLDTLGGGLEYLYQLNTEIPPQILFDCAQAVETIYDTIMTSSNEECPVLSLLEQLHDTIRETVENWGTCGLNAQYQQMKTLFCDACSSAKQDLKVHIEIAFMPYKFAMWDSLESIWRSAIEDEQCECYLVPIPYFDRNSDGTLGSMHDESYLFESVGKVIRYTDYPLETRRPDIIYVHNPYDKYNYVTTIHPSFYSAELKKHTDCLVYVPYFISGHYSSEQEVQNNLNMPAYSNFDYVVSQSKPYDQLLNICGVPSNRILPFGNPKFDAVQYKMENPPPMPPEWEPVIAGKKVFLLSTVINAILNLPGWLKKVRGIIELVASNEQAALIWRPHPLLRQSVSSMRPKMINEFDDLLKFAKQTPSIIFDDSADPYPAIVFSDALISEYSSLIFQFLNTGKPAFALTSRSNFRKTKMWAVDWYDAYFEQDGIQLERFIDIVLRSADSKSEQRLSKLRNSLYFSDGTSGEHIHRFLVAAALK